jgi:hypothetical protein
MKARNAAKKIFVVVIIAICKAIFCVWLFEIGFAEANGFVGVGVL